MKGAAAGVEFERFVHEGKFVVLEFFSDVLPYSFGIFTYEIYVDHGSIIIQIFAKCN